VWAKAGAMEHWDEIVTDRRLTLELAETHLERVVSQGPAYLLGDYQVVTSGGSSGTRAELAQSSYWRPACGGPLRPAHGAAGREAISPCVVTRWRWFEIQSASSRALRALCSCMNSGYALRDD
jgi:hypothetical protein